MDNKTPESWQIVLCVGDKKDLPVFESVLDPFVDGISVNEEADAEGYRVVGFCSLEPIPSEIELRLLVGGLAIGIEPPKYQIESIDGADWVAEYQARIRPITIGPFFIYPDHCTDMLPSNKIPITLNAGLAFGTGEHQTTEGCLRFLEFLATHGLQVRNAIDIGCGSAILAIAASKLWLDIKLIACDNDPSAVLTALENVRKNNCTDSISVFGSDFYSAPEIKDFRPFDLIIANILAAPLIGAALETAKHLSLTGRLILSGMLNEQVEDVISAYKAVGLICADQLEINGWTTLVLKVQ